MKNKITPQPLANTMFIAVKLSNSANSARNIWVKLPATTEQFHKAVSSICRESDKFTIKDYSTNLIGLAPYSLMEMPLSFVNYLASQLKTLTNDEVEKLTAIMVSDKAYWDYRPKCVLEYTISPENYTLFSDVYTNEELVFYYFKTMKIPRFIEFIKGSVKLRLFGKAINYYEQIGESLCWQQKGIFSPLGYIKSEIGWHGEPLPYFVPRNFCITDCNGSEIYGRLPDESTQEEIEYEEDELEYEEDEAI